MDTYTLQYASDLHIDADSLPFSMLIEPVATELALCGDICDPFSQLYSDFLKWCSQRWNKIYLVAGNHEYFTKGPNILITDTDAQIRRVVSQAGPNIVFLQNEYVFIEQYKIVIIGSTLWSVPSQRHWDKIGINFIGNPGKKGEYTSMYKQDEYTGKPRLVHPSDITTLCLENTAFLRKALNTTWGIVPDGWRAIVLTHHLPTVSLADAKYRNDPHITCYSTALDDLMTEPVVAWICGHSHNSKVHRFLSGTVACLNPRGYKNQITTSGYSRRAVIQVYRENIAIPRIFK
jgi:hypothetical protein